MKLSGPSTTKKERAQIKKWEVLYVDTIGKFQVKSVRDYYYYSVFVDRKDVEKISTCHTKKRYVRFKFLDLNLL
jgi:hypothetical protein